MTNTISPEKLDADLLIEYMSTFYGYGNWHSDFWFVGLEEGGGDSFLNINNRLLSWIKLNKTDLIDNKDHHTNIGLDLFFNRGILQNTWRKLILTKLSFEGKTTEKHAVVETQKNDWGHLESSNLLIELFPLPSPSNIKWNYKDWTDIDYLIDRNAYYHKIASIRIAHIKKQIELSKPNVIIFYGKVMLHRWYEIIGTNQLQEVDILNKKISYLVTSRTCYIICPHPASVYSNNFWILLGVKIRDISANNL